MTEKSRPDIVLEIFKDSACSFSLRTLHDEKIHASGSVEACIAASRLLFNHRFDPVKLDFFRSEIYAV
jgi:hypothetical protein